MSDLLPIVFARGQNEGIDPRVAPPDVHRVAQNVRWRKDGRPAKRYGLTSLSTTGLDAGLSYTSQFVNAVGKWNTEPVFVIGSGVRTLANGVWSGVKYPGYGELSHWGPGERDIITRDERALLQNVTSGICGGYVVHAWDDGTSLWYSVRRADGSTIIAPNIVVVGTYPRIVGTANYLYVLYRSGTTIALMVFDPSNISLTGASSPGTLFTTASMFDACPRGTDFVLVYQDSATTLKTKLLSAIASPAVTQTQNALIASGVSRMSVASDATNSVFVACLDASSQLTAFVWNNALTVNTGANIIETDANDSVQPGLALQSTGVCQVVWGGYIAATETAYMRATTIGTAGTVTTSIGTYYGVTPASKPFFGPAYPTFPGDGGYVWVHTHNSSQEAGGNSKWNTQRTFYLVQYAAATNGILRRQLHTPNVVASVLPTQNHLSDVIALGVGNGYLVPLPSAIRFGNGFAAAIGLDVVNFHSAFENLRYAARDTANAGRVLQFTGGSLYELNGFAEETGFTNFPVIESVTGGGGGSITSGNYIYRAVYEYIDLQGRRHRSAPSDPFAYTSGANTSATLVVKPLVANTHFPGGAVSLHIYRTLAGQSTYHRVTPNIAPPAGSVFAATVSFVDTMSDAALAGQEFIYTDGGVADNTLAPPSTFATYCAGRVWLGGQLDRCIITASKLLVDGEPTQFSDLDVFSVQLPEKCTGLASLDGTVVAFARERIYLVQGDGPNDQGVGQFSAPIALPTDVGCIDWRSVAETSLGVFFQSKRGIYLLPRGFNTPLFVGAEVEDTLATYPIVVSATAVIVPSSGSGKLGEVTVRFVLAADETNGGTVIAVYDLRSQGWSVDSNGFSGGVGPSGSWSDTFVVPQVVGPTLTGLAAESSSSYSDAIQYIRTALGTGDIRPFGVGGYGQFNKVLIMGEYRGNAQVQVQVSVDGATADVSLFSVTSADAPDGVVYLDVTPRVQKGTSLRVTVNDAADAGTGGANTEGFIAQALFIESELIGKTKRLPAGRKA